MGVPGPSGTALVLGLLFLALVATALGEGARRLLARWVPSWRALEAMERLLLDFFLGGAVFYLVAALPVGAFQLPVLVALLALAGAILILRALDRPRHRPEAETTIVGAGPSSNLAPVSGLPGSAFARSLVRPWVAVALASALGLLIFEVWVALPIGTGNTYDSGLLTLYTARLVDLHQIPLSVAPYAPVGLLYPQGATVWLGAAQLLLGLPGARTSLLVTPLFFALAPVGGFVLGRRTLGSDRGGAAFALMLAGTASWTRVLVGGSNDFVFAFPLVLLLAGQAIPWWRAVPSLGDAAGLGLLLGYSAAINPVGAEWLLLALAIGGVLVLPRFGGAVRTYAGRWMTAAGAALLPLIPTWYVLAQGIGSPGFVPGAGAAPSGAGHGISSARFVGSIDPYLFRSGDVLLSPIPGLRFELAVLLTVGLALLVLAYRTPIGRYLGNFRTLFIAGAVAAIALLGLEWAGSGIGGIGAGVASFTSAQELTFWLFTLYSLTAAIPLAILFEWTRVSAHPPTGTGSTAEPRRRSARLSLRGVVPVALALAILVPGAVLTPVQLPSVLSQVYEDFGNVTSADFDLLAYSGAHLPAGTHVLIAPGSVAGFLPAYASNVVLLYPMVPGWEWINASYTGVVDQLTHGYLNQSGVADLVSLGIDYVAVTGWNTILWPPFDAGPLAADPSQFTVDFHEGDAWLFSVVPSLPPNP